MLKTACGVDESAQSKTEDSQFLLILRGVAIIESSADVTSRVLLSGATLVKLC